MFKNIVHLSKGRRIDWHHLVLGAEVDIVVVDRVARYTDARLQVVVLVQPDEGGRGGVSLVTPTYCWPSNTRYRGREGE